MSCEHKRKFYVNIQTNGRVETDCVFCADCEETLYDRRRGGLPSAKEHIEAMEWLKKNGPKAGREVGSQGKEPVRVAESLMNICQNMEQQSKEQVRKDQEFEKMMESLIDMEQQRSEELKELERKDQEFIDKVESNFKASPEARAALTKEKCELLDQFLVDSGNIWAKTLYPDLRKWYNDSLDGGWDRENEEDGDHLSRQEMAEVVCELADKIKAMFDFKNVGYGQAEDGLHNFRSSAARNFGEPTPANMLKVLQVLQDKHLVALANKGLDLKDFEERCIDVAVYSLIAIGIARETGR